MATMTKDEFMEQHGDVLVKFASYYKYDFTFTGMLDNGCSISVNVGGDSSDIYKMSVDADDEQAVYNLSPDSGEVFDVNGVMIGEFYDN